MKKLFMCILASLMIIMSACSKDADTVYENDSQENITKDAENESDISSSLEKPNEKYLKFVMESDTEEGYEITDKDIEDTLYIMKLRFGAASYGSAEFETKRTETGVTIEVKIPGADEFNDEMISFICDSSRLLFKDPDGKEILNDSHVANAYAGEGQDGAAIINLEFTPEGTALFAEATTALVGEKISIYLDNELISEPTVNVPITEGQCYIQGDFTTKEAEEFSKLINIGMGPLKMNFVSQEVIKE